MGGENGGGEFGRGFLESGGNGIPPIRLINFAELDTFGIFEFFQ